MSNFRVGQKVVCIKKDTWNNIKHNETCPRFGEVLTVRCIDHDFEGAWLRFEEIVNPLIEYSCGLCEAHFRSDRFRPVIERKTDISIFQEMLAPNRRVKVVQ